MTSSAASEPVLPEFLRRRFRAYRYAPISPAHGLVRRLFRSLIARHQRVRLGNGLRLELDLASVVQQAIFWLDGDYDLPLQWVIRELLPLGTACVDCGANCGYIGLLARRFREAPVWFVEPHPRLAGEIRRNVALNGWDRDCTVVEAAASDGAGEVTLFEHPSMDGSHSLLPDWERPSAAGPVLEIKVRRGTLPDLLGDSPKLEHIGLLKVDAEGHDFTVLQGLGDWLNPKRIGMIHLELGAQRAAGYQLLERAGYAGFGLPHRSPRELRRAFHAFDEGRPVAVFEPLDPARHGEVETLWLPRSGPAAAQLATLARLGA
jgi:FkbM family methyltransferase